MGHRPSSTIAFGVFFPEGTVFPWDSEYSHGGLEKWLLNADGFKPKTVVPEIYTKEGNFKPGLTEAEKNEYREKWFELNKEEVEFRENNTEKIAICETGSDECSSKGICLKSSYSYIDWDNEFFELTEEKRKNLFVVSDEDKEYLSKLIEEHIKPFMEKTRGEYHDEIDYTMKWTWSCYYG